MRVAGDGYWKSLLDRFAGFFPGSDATLEIVHTREIHLGQLVAGFSAAASGCTVDQISLVVVQFARLLPKIRRVPINVDGPGNMAGRKFCRGADIKHDVLFVGAEF